MSKAKKDSVIKPEKVLRKEVADTLKDVFSEIKAAVGEKKFSKKVKKASKLLTAGALEKAAKKLKKEKKAAKKNKPVKVGKLVKAEKKAFQMVNNNGIQPQPVDTPTNTGNVNEVN
jgi:hypothetical protein